jgi:acyl transferase domain-containing protein/nucleoside-diphosphate-sugar epimerase/acyl carrier protein/SAM-dependent methyltransferase
VSVWYDENQATVTTSQRTVSKLKERLDALGMTANEMGLYGRFHAGQLHEPDRQALVSFCEYDPLFRFTEASGAALPTNLEIGDKEGGGIKFHETALRAILVDPADWFNTLNTVSGHFLEDANSRVVSFGPQRCIPRSMFRNVKAQMQAVDFDTHGNSDAATGTLPSNNHNNDIAVVGMSINVAGAADLDDFWSILQEGRSQHQEVPTDRFEFDTVFRPKQDGSGDTSRKWYGNFIKDHDAFDHRFFKKSAREAASMDPQQRLLHQVAYQAVAQSGYFQKPDSQQRKDVGCYVGVCGDDYENNVSHHQPTAFSATGNLRSFIAGKISHYFGWTGPGLTIDTACSASAVAIHQACRAILNGECSAALAAGTNFISSPLWYQNLAAASFLSPTGQCKPFDALADGYCRGEAIAGVFLKRLSQAQADGDRVFGIISGTAVCQNQNCTPIFVPNAPSLAGLFRTVLAQAGLDSRQISYVEAHGTGTPVGDPAEYDSIRQTFVGRPGDKNIRPRPLQMGSVKGLVGHTEGSSGIVSLIKVLLMMYEGFIPPQASFKALNPSISSKPSDNMAIATKVLPWQDDFKAALINNYGASGSNASIVVKQAQPCFNETATNPLASSTSAIRNPFYITGADSKSLQAYVTRLRRFLQKEKEDVLAGNGKRYRIQDLSFNLARQLDWSQESALIFSAQSVDEVDQKLAAFQQEDQSASIVRPSTPAPRPVILCFGGQVSTFIGLDRQVYDRVQVLRYWLDQCDATCQSLGAKSIYPDIFYNEPVEDASKLQPMLFAMQYACAMAWIDCGVQPAAVVGHSFGELTALCVSGVLSLKDALKMVWERSKLIRDSWGPEKGAMMAVEADLEQVENLLAQVAQANQETEPATIACFNGPRSFTLAGSTAGIDAAEQTITSSNSMRYKRLNVTNAFHSTLAEKLKPDLEALGQTLSFGLPKIHLERATKHSTSQTEKLSANYVANHMRDPVFFNQAVQRLAGKHNSAIWLEAGSNSTIMTIASKALGMPQGSSFQPVNITSGQPWQQLVDTTIRLWEAGQRAAFWAHSRRQTSQFISIILPPYQFDKQRHWLEFKSPPAQLVQDSTVISNKAGSEQDALPTALFTFLGFQDNKQDKARFRINTMIKKYHDIVSGHVIANTAPICPATVQIDMAIEAIMSIHPELSSARLQPQISNVKNQSPICNDPARAVELSFERDHSKAYTWTFKVTSIDAKGPGAMTHTIGELCFQAPDDAQFRLEFSRYGRLVSHKQCLEVLNSMDADDIVQGRSIYKVFSEVVDYGDQYYGLQKLVGRGSESAGRVVKLHSGETWLDAFLGDCFSQVGGIWVNCMANESRNNMFIANGFEMWTRAPASNQSHDDSKNNNNMEWHVLARHVPTTAASGPGDGFLTDIFVFDSTTGRLAEIILGIHYAKVPRLSMMKLLARLSPGVSSQTGASATVGSNGGHAGDAGDAFGKGATGGLSRPIGNADILTMNTNSNSPPSGVKQGGTQPGKSDLSRRLKAVLAELAGLQPDEIKDETDLADIGIDSLMGMEMARDVEREFSCTLDQGELMLVRDLPGMLSCLQSALDSFVDDDDLVQSEGEDIFSSTPPSGSDSEQGSNTTDTTSTDKPSAAIPVNSTRENKGETQCHDDEKAQALNLEASVVLEAFSESKLRTDHFIQDHSFAGYLDKVLPKQTNLCIALAAEAFKQLGCDLSVAQPGQELQRITCASQHGRFLDSLYRMLEETRIIDIDTSHSAQCITRTAIALPSRASDAILQDLIHDHPGHNYSNQLTHWTGTRIADVLTGKVDGVKLIFGDIKGRELVAGLYGDCLINKLFYHQMSDFLQRLVAKISLQDVNGTLRILEMGAGTGGTTKVSQLLFDILPSTVFLSNQDMPTNSSQWLVPMLAKLGIPIEYTFTDLSPSFVVAARKKYKGYPFMRFAVHDIEKPPPESRFVQSQHIVIASNAVHATHSLDISTANMRQFLRPDGFVMMLEMTATLYWVDVIFGILEGWWLFDDGRKHAVADERHWEKVLHDAGYGHVDWTDGQSREVRIQKIIIAMASGPKLDRLPAPSSSLAAINHDTRRLETERYVELACRGFAVPDINASGKGVLVPDISKICVVVTGASGSLGCHLVTHLASLPTIHTVYCINRPNGVGKAVDPFTRQVQAFESKGIIADAPSLSKLHVLDTDTSKPRLGLSQEEYDNLVHSATHIMHNAWPMSGKRPLKGFESQFAVMRNLVDLAASISACRSASPGFKVSFQLISSIATVGHYPLISNHDAHVPEERTRIEAVLPNGYGDAKFVCESILDKTLHQYPNQFRAMSVRLGQVAGSSRSGYWNHMEHFSFMVKSAQTLRALPNLDGPLSWTPVDEVAGTLADLILYNDGNWYPVYHIDNPVRQPWKELTAVLAEALGVPKHGIIPFADWIRRVRAFPGAVEWDNPAAKLVDFLGHDFERMSCGGVLLATEKAREHSPTLRNVGPVSANVVRKYVQSWKEKGFLR